MIDLARRPRRVLGPPRLWSGLLWGLLLSALMLVTLRSDLLRLRYGLAHAIEEEKDLLEQRRVLTARVRALRDPARLLELARARGLERPMRSIVLDRPSAVDPAP